MSNEIAAKEFLEYYLQSAFKDKIDSSKITIEKESYIEETLQEKFSDIVYSVKTKSDDSAFIYILLDHQSTVDYWMALRLWRYALLLCERHKKNKDKLPLIYSMIMYNGREVYNAPRNLWDLFIDPVQAKELMVSDYQLVDLQSMSDDEIVQKKHLGMMEYVMKHIHQRDMVALWEKFLETFKLEVLVDKKQGYVYIKSFLSFSMNIFRFL
ncbi:transposase [Trichonephila clavata]|uniref:Transposase n=1 Tax=Trichonephila clavata TaxID=2740835 RepID=A0A8X6LQ48_TRICU|nr:transposase [Trichonephila clavata]